MTAYPKSGTEPAGNGANDKRGTAGCGRLERSEPRRTREKNKEQRKKDRKPRSGYEIGHTASPKDLYKAGMTQRGREKQKQNKDKAKR